MKDNKIDNLFKEKLEGHAKTPSPMAWEKLSSELSKKDKRSGFLWWHKAAILLLVCLSGFLIFRSAEVSDGNEVATNQIKSEKEDGLQPKFQQEPKAETNLQVQNSPVPEKEPLPPIADNTKAIEAEVEKKLIKKEPKSDRRLFQESPVNNYVAVNSEQTQEDPMATTDPEGLDEGIENADTKKASPPVTIEFRSGKRKKEQTLMAGAEKEDIQEDQSFSLKRLVAAVKDVKAGEIGLAEIRQAKDDLFAFDTYKEDSKNRDK